MNGARPMLSLVKATEREVNRVWAVYQACTAAMLARGIRQWDDSYPSRATAVESAARGDLFLIVDEAGQLVGSVILNAEAPPQYEGIEWKEAGPALVIHTLVIDPRRQGGGMGRAAMEGCEGYARKQGFGCVRLDAYPGNPAAIALYERLGYALRGHVHFPWKPAGHERYAVYEKAM
jgi:ribosomal protein S18 acetylase RimI-like enzyme